MRSSKSKATVASAPVFRSSERAEKRKEVCILYLVNFLAICCVAFLFIKATDPLPILVPKKGKKLFSIPHDISCVFQITTLLSYECLNTRNGIRTLISP